jgi:hypothetical protein
MSEYYVKNEFYDHDVDEDLDRDAERKGSQPYQ